MSNRVLGWVVLAALWTLPAVAGAETRAYFASVPTNAADIRLEAALEVTSLDAFSPAEDAGVLVGDRLIGLSNRRIRSLAELGFVRDLLPRGDGLSVQVLRDGAILSLPVAGLNKQGRLGTVSTAPDTSVARVALEALGIPPSEYLGVAQGGRDDGGALEKLLAGYAPTNALRCHPVLVQLTRFPARASERIRERAEAGQPGLRAWVVGLLKVHYALMESRWADAQRHLEEAKLLATPMDPFLDGLADFYRRLADAPPDAARGVDLKRYGVTPEYFALCFPAPLVPLKLHDWSPMSPQFAADFARRAEDLPWNAQAYERAAQREFATTAKPGAVDYMHLVRGALLYPERYGGYPTRYAPLFKEDACREVLAALKATLATDAKHRELAALALITPSALVGDTNAYRQAMMALREAGSRELGVANAYTLETWMRHGARPSYEAFEAIRREVNESLGIPGVYTWLAARSRTYADRLAYGWYYMKHGGLTDGSGLIQTPATVEALGGPQELTTAPAGP